MPKETGQATPLKAVSKRAVLRLFEATAEGLALAACGIRPSGPVPAPSVPTPGDINGQRPPEDEQNLDPYSENVANIGLRIQNLDPYTLPAVLEQPGSPEEIQAVEIQNPLGDLLTLGEGENNGSLLTTNEASQLAPVAAMAIIWPNKRLDTLFNHISQRKAQEIRNCPDKTGHDWRLTLIILAAALGVEEVTEHGFSAKIVAIGARAWEGKQFIEVITRVPLAALEQGLQNFGTNLKEMGLDNLAKLTEELLYEERDILFKMRLPTAASQTSGSAFFINTAQSFKNALAEINARANPFEGFKNVYGTFAGGYLMRRLSKSVLDSLKAVGNGKKCNARRIINSNPTPAVAPAIDNINDLMRDIQPGTPTGLNIIPIYP